MLFKFNLNHGIHIYSLDFLTLRSLINDCYCVYNIKNIIDYNEIHDDGMYAYNVISAWIDNK